MNAWIRCVCLPALAFLALAGCGPQEPIRIGLMAGLSDKGSDLGESVRTGVILAIEHQNQAGGIHGRPIELIVRDDGQDPDLAIRAARELIALKPEIVIGPVTSAMAKSVIPMMNEAGLTPACCTSAARGGWAWSTTSPTVPIPKPGSRPSRSALKRWAARSAAA